MNTSTISHALRRSARPVPAAKQSVAETAPKAALKRPHAHTSTEVAALNTAIHAKEAQVTALTAELAANQTAKETEVTALTAELAANQTAKETEVTALTTENTALATENTALTARLAELAEDQRKKLFPTPAELKERAEKKLEETERKAERKSASDAKAADNASKRQKLGDEKRAVFVTSSATHQATMKLTLAQAVVDSKRMPVEKMYTIMKGDSFALTLAGKAVSNPLFKHASFNVTTEEEMRELNLSVSEKETRRRHDIENKIFFDKVAVDSIATITAIMMPRMCKAAKKNNGQLVKKSTDTTTCMRESGVNAVMDCITPGKYSFPPGSGYKNMSAKGMRAWWTSMTMAVFPRMSGKEVPVADKTKASAAMKTIFRQALAAEFDKRSFATKVRDGKIPV